MDDQVHTFTGKEAETAKAFITADNVPDRKRYAKSTKNELRTASFMASVNGRELFTEQVNRRYIVFCMDNSLEYALDWEALKKIDINQVWAQAYSLLKKGEPYLYTSEEKLIIKGKNEQFKKTSPEEEAIHACFTKGDPAALEARWHQATELMALANRALRMNFNIQQFSRALKAIGFEPQSKKSKEYGNQARKLYCVKYQFTEYSNGSINFDHEPPNTETNDNNQATATI